MSIHTIVSKSERPQQKNKPRMGRPPSKAAYLSWVNKTLELAAAIKTGAGGISNAKIETALGIGAHDRDKDTHTDTGLRTGRYFARYLNESGKGKPVALTPDLLAQLAERARAQGWLKKSQKSSLIQIPDPFEELSIPDGELMTERLSQIQTERLDLLQARQEAVVALNRLSTVMASCRLTEFMHLVTDMHEGEETGVWFDGFAVDLSQLASKLAAAVVIADGFSRAADLAPYVPISPDSRMKAGKPARKRKVRTDQKK